MLEILFLSSAGRAENFTSPPSVLMILVYVMVKSPHLLVDTMHGWLYLFPYSSNSHNPVVIQIVTITAMPKAITVSKMPQCLQRNATRPPSGMSTIAVPITFFNCYFQLFHLPTSSAPRWSRPDNLRSSLENQTFPCYTPLISTAMLK